MTKLIILESPNSNTSQKRSSFFCTVLTNNLYYKLQEIVATKVKKQSILKCQTIYLFIFKELLN